MSCNVFFFSSFLLLFLTVRNTQMCTDTETQSERGRERCVSVDTANSFPPLIALAAVGAKSHCVQVQQTVVHMQFCLMDAHQAAKNTTNLDVNVKMIEPESPSCILQFGFIASSNKPAEDKSCPLSCLLLFFHTFKHTGASCPQSCSLV